MTDGRPLDQTVLFDRVWGAMLGGAIGDAMGGPVEGWTYQRMMETHGVVDDLLPYDTPPDYHNHFATAAGTVTDDTRLKHLVARAVVEAGGRPRRGDLVRTIVDAYHAADTQLARGFLEEYALGGIYGEAKLIWGGQMTNGFLMANAPVGIICPGDPEAAFALSYDLDFISDGYATYSAAMGAAAVAAALAPGATPASVVAGALSAASSHRVVGPLTRDWRWYDHVFALNERLVTTAVEVAERHRDVFSLRAEYYEQLRVGDLGSEAAQTLAVALGMVVAAEGDPRLSIVGAVNYGRDNDSYATLAGAIAGALHGAGALPERWSATVVAANPEPDVRALSLDLVRIVADRQEKRRRALAAVDALFSGKMTAK
jgi:ADP-ribosylglycohydrolase